MDKSTVININVMDIAQKYAEKVRENYRIETIILFGSYAKGTEREDSDIDIAIITDDIANDMFDEQLKLKRLRWEIDLRIEPHIIRIEDYKKISTPFIKEVVDTGIKIA